MSVRFQQETIGKEFDQKEFKIICRGVGRVKDRKGVMIQRGDETFDVYHRRPGVLEEEG